jgi:hypothetical protein
MLNNLLNSVQLSKIKPDYIIIVSSGDDITRVIEVYEKSLEILHHHTDEVGQSNQKIIAIRMLKSDTNWVFFLDDDLELSPTSLNEAFRRIKLVKNENINGIGANIVNRSLNSQQLRRGKFQSKKQVGKIKASGRATKYAFHDVAYTEWLNGASIWRKECLSQYMLPVLDSTYAAYEDVIFSSRVARTSKLIFDPSIILHEQIPHSQVVLSYRQFKYITLWTGYLVCARSDTKIINYKLLTLARLIFFTFSRQNKHDFKLSKIASCFKFVFKILILSGNKVKSNVLLIALLNNENKRF